MDTRNWFGAHAGAIKLIALAGGIALAAIILLDMLTHKNSTTSAAPATGLDTSPATSGESATSTLQNPGETYISILEDYSSHVNDTTTNNPPTTTLPPVVPVSPYRLPRRVPGLPGPVNGFMQPQTILTSAASAPTSAPTSTGGATVPVATPHPAEQYTVRSGDTLFGIAQRFLGNGADWRELYTWNRATVGGNPNLIYPGETLYV